MKLWNKLKKQKKLSVLMKKFNNILYVFFCLLIIAVQGCGQTGELYLPEEAKNLVFKNEYRS